MPTETTYWAHPTALVDNGAQIGAGTRIWHFSHISGQAISIGENCSFGQNCYVGNRVRIGRGVRVQNNVSIYDQVELEDYVFCGPSMVFTNVMNPRAHVPRKHEFQPTTARRGATLGANCTVICGVEIGRFAFVAAGSMVSRDVPPFALVKGIPASNAGWVCHCGIPLKGDRGRVSCSQCHSEYELADHHCRPVVMKNCFEEN